MAQTDSPIEEKIRPRQVVGFVVALVVACVLLPFTQADRGEAERLTVEVASRKLAEDSSALVDKNGSAPSYEGPAELRESTLARLFGSSDALVAPGTTVVVGIDESLLTLDVSAAALEKPLQRTQRVGDWTSILPPLIAVLIALFFKKLLIALVSAVWLGGTLGMGGNPATGLWRGASEFIWGSVSDGFNLYIVVFTLSLVGMVQLVTRAGGVAGVIDKVSGLAKTARSTRLATALMGGAIFFDDYANTVVVGSTMRPLADRQRISREKLAYIVDSTSAPIAGIAIVSTWIGYEVGLFDDLSRQLQLGQSGYDIFFGILPLRFYCLFTLGFVFLNAWSGRDFGPMLKAERRALNTGQVLRIGAKPLTSAAFASIEPRADIEHRWYNAFIPVTTVLAGVFVGMFWSGWSAGELTIPALTAGPGPVVSAWKVAIADMGTMSAWRDAFSNADNAKVLFWASMLGSIVAIVLVSAQRLLTPVEAIKTWLGAVPAMRLAVAILVLAWSIRAVCDDLGTSIYLVGAVQDLLTPELLPLVTFGLAAGVAFSTGTSWGTMGILLPALIPLAFYMTEGADNAFLILLLCFGAVLDGAIFGDHCSPISDTTVMSSIASSCDHLDHVQTQTPYAVTTMLAAAVFGYVGVAFGLSVWLAYVFAGLFAIGVLRFVGRPILQH